MFLQTPSSDMNMSSVKPDHTIIRSYEEEVVIHFKNHTSEIQDVKGLQQDVPESVHPILTTDQESQGFLQAQNVHFTKLGRKPVLL